MADGALSRDELVAIFRDGLGVELPSPGTDLIATGLLDSLALVTLLYEVEVRTGVTIPFETLDVDDLATADRILALVGRLAAEGR